MIAQPKDSNLELALVALGVGALIALVWASPFLLPLTVR